jgi:hypothetical protein
MPACQCGNPNPDPDTICRDDSCAVTYPHSREHCKSDARMFPPVLREPEPIAFSGYADPNAFGMQLPDSEPGPKPDARMPAWVCLRS